MNFGAHHSLHNHLDETELIENLLSLPISDLFLIEAENWLLSVQDVKLRYRRSKEVLLGPPSQVKEKD